MEYELTSIKSKILNILNKHLALYIHHIIKQRFEHNEKLHTSGSIRHKVICGEKKKLLFYNGDGLK